MYGECSTAINTLHHSKISILFYECIDIFRVSGGEFYVIGWCIPHFEPCQTLIFRAKHSFGCGGHDHSRIFGINLQSISTKALGKHRFPGCTTISGFMNLSSTTHIDNGRVCGVNGNCSDTTTEIIVSS